MKTKLFLFSLVILTACTFNAEPKTETKDTLKHETIIDTLALPDSASIQLHPPTEAKQGEKKTN